MPKGHTYNNLSQPDPDHEFILFKLNDTKNIRYDALLSAVSAALGGGTLVLGETDTTAYRGDRGKIAYDHSQLASGNPHGVTAADVGAIPIGEKGSANGVAELDSGGKVLAAQLPGFVDDVLEYSDFASFPGSGESGKLYVADDTGAVYRWSGSAYVQISSGGDLVLGETDTTAYRGDRGAAAYAHSQVISGNPHGVTASDVGLGNVDNTSDVDKPVSAATQAALNDKEDVGVAQGLIDGLTPADIGAEDDGAAAVVQGNLDTHEARTDNPHSVTAADVGLGNVDNTADSAKPVSGPQQTALDGKLDSPSASTVTTATHTFALSDAHTVVVGDSGSAQTFTIPTNAAVAFPIGTQILVIQEGAGEITVEGDSGVTVNGSAAGSVSNQGQNKSLGLVKVATDKWFVLGGA